MPIFRNQRRQPETVRPTRPPPEDIVRAYLRGQNLEQVLRTDEAVAAYEQAVAAGFDSAGPYDRLIAIYGAREAYADVVRVADAALEHVRTFDDKREWYRTTRTGAAAALASRPDGRGAEFSDDLLARSGSSPDRRRSQSG